MVWSKRPCRPVAADQEGFYPAGDRRREKWWEEVSDEGWKRVRRGRWECGTWCSDWLSRTSSWWSSHLFCLNSAKTTKALHPFFFPLITRLPPALSFNSPLTFQRILTSQIVTSEPQACWDNAVKLITFNNWMPDSTGAWQHHLRGIVIVLSLFLAWIRC